MDGTSNAQIATITTATIAICIKYELRLNESFSIKQVTAAKKINAKVMMPEKRFANQYSERVERPEKLA